MTGHVVLIAAQLLVVSGDAEPAGRALQAEDLRVLDEPASGMMRDYLTALVEEQFARREALLGKLQTAEDWKRHAERIRRAMAGWTGPFPPRSPLKARVTGRIERSEYVMEKVLFESRPGFVVSANLYLPKRFQGRRPAVLNVIGHSAEGKAAEKVQRRCVAQARKGFVALAIDAIGQGERQVPEYAGHGRPPGNAHSVLGLQAFLAGTHLFNLMAWDAIRAVDYLVSRPEVDPARIGCTGCSGGGMMTTYILPFESRITVAVPACNPNTWLYRVRAGLATDHEQVFPGAFAAGVDPRGDPLMCHVPKPLLINATTRDSLNPPAGVWALSRWLQKAYAAHRVPERFQTVMIPGRHGYNLQQREATYAWLLKWLDGGPAEPAEGDFAVEPAQDTWCTPGGNVYLEQPQRTRPHGLVLEYLAGKRTSWPAVADRQALDRHKRRLRRAIRELLKLPEQAAVPQATTGEARNWGAMRIRPVVLRPEEDILLPAVWIEPLDEPKRGESRPVVLYLHERGKATLARRPLAERLVRTRRVRILAVDLRGLGETAPGQEGKFWDFLAGRPILAQRVADVRSVLAWLGDRDEPASHIAVWGQGVTGLCAALAVALDGTASALVIEEPLLSFESVVRVDVPGYGNEILVAGLLERFDLPQVYQACCPAPVTLIGPLRGDRQPASSQRCAQAYGPVAQAYRAAGAAGHWRVLTGGDRQQRTEWIADTLSPPDRQGR